MAELRYRRGEEPASLSWKLIHPAPIPDFDTKIKDIASSPVWFF